MNTFELARVVREHELWADTNGADGKKADFQGANLANCKLQNCNLKDVSFKGANLCDNLKYGWCSGNKAFGIFDDSIERDIELDQAFGNLVTADLQGANLENADFEGANLQGVNFENVNLKNANFKRAKLRGANFEGANLENADLEGANLRCVDFDNANLENANLKNTNLRGLKWYDDIATIIRRTRFNSTNLKNANLQDAKISYASFNNANLENTNLSNNNLSKATFVGSNIKDTIFKNSTFGFCNYLQLYFFNDTYKDQKKYVRTTRTKRRTETSSHPCDIFVTSFCLFLSLLFTVVLPICIIIAHCPPDTKNMKNLESNSVTDKNLYKTFIKKDGENKND